MRKKHERAIAQAACDGATEPQIEAMSRMFQAELDRFNNTWIWYSIAYNEVVVTLHNTEIVRIDSDGLIRLYAEGWQTVTTKKRMNEVLDALQSNILDRYTAVRVWQENFEWSVHWLHYHNVLLTFAETAVFEDGIDVGLVR